ncbi:Rossmann-like and DUF2520 domain-containing protein [Caloramator sp. E03]|uniref:Rossmann-like and DUF2520 domain-containing protein n=1 Tax=Caloramator sp. E03 TaxID=2576307 RepID=UPI002110BD8C|nr:Rossmann-like and DUF2520 domain-containing protein [Caloramator sp. E03]
MEKMKIGFIGAGKVGCAFGRYLTERGLDVEGYYSRSILSCQSAADFTKTKVLSLEELILSCDYIFITTPDNVISSLWESIKNFDLKGKSIFHMSGCLTTDVFCDAKKIGVFSYSLHPLYPFTDRECYKYLKDVIFSVEGENINNIKSFLDLAGLKYFLIDKNDKAKYHAAAVFASNYIVSLAKISKEILLECNMDEKFIVDAIYPLMQGAILNIKEKGVEDSLTGPIVRGDYNTIKLHLDSIEKYKEIYKSLGLTALNIEMEKLKRCKDEDCMEKMEKLNKIEKMLRGDK